VEVVEREYHVVCDLLIICAKVQKKFKSSKGSKDER
jgi:hypothetical protein